MKVLSILMAITMVISTSGLTFAFTQDGSPVVFDATVTTTGIPGVIVGLDADLFDVVGDAPAGTTVSWTAAAGNDWVVANQYISVDGFETYSTWGIQIYTDNENGIPEYTGAGNPAGLVNAGNSDVAIPMCWRVVADTKYADGSTDLTITEQYIPTDDIYVLLRIAGDYVADDDYFAPWFWMLDKETPDVDPATVGDQVFGDYQDYATAVGSSGVQIAPDTYVGIPSSGSDYNVYLGAKFTTAAAGATYTTDTLTVEMYHL